MDEDIQKLKPYINNLKRHLQVLKPELEKFAKDSLNDKLIILTNEMDKLNLVNNYSYILNSLLFAYMKLIGCKNIDNTIMVELNRCKEYMQKAKQIVNRQNNKEARTDSEQQKLKSNILNSLNKPSISRENFQNKHIKFQEEKKEKDTSDKDLLSEKIIDNQKKKNKKSKNKNKNRISKK